jgi:hypothetical protein
VPLEQGLIEKPFSSLQNTFATGAMRHGYRRSVSHLIASRLSKNRAHRLPNVGLGPQESDSEWSCYRWLVAKMDID